LIWHQNRSELSFCSPEWELLCRYPINTLASGESEGREECGRIGRLADALEGLSGYGYPVDVSEARLVVGPFTLGTGIRYSKCWLY
jgi:hypothetical protein